MLMPMCPNSNTPTLLLLAAGLLLLPVSDLAAQVDSGDAGSASQAAPENPGGSAPASAPTAAPQQSTEEYLAAVMQQQRLTQQIRNIRKPLLSREAEKEFIKVSRNYRSLLGNGPNLASATDQALIRQGLEYRILRASDPAVQESPRLMANALNDLRRDLKSAGSQITNPQNRSRFREDVCREAHRILRMLLDNSLDARSFAISVLVDLEVVPAAFQQTRIIILDEAAVTLAEILTDASQPDTIRAIAAAQIERFLRTTDAVPVVQMNLARTLATELARWNTDPAYQLVLIDALARVTTPREVVGKNTPTAIEALAATMADRNRRIDVRCRAARGVGRVGFDAQINFDPLAWKVVQLCAETGEFFNGEPGNQAFAVCAADLYLAFHHMTRDEASPDSRNPAGMLNRAPTSQLVKAAYSEALKVVLPMLDNAKAIPKNDLKSVFEWASQNAPSSLVFDQNATPLSK